jgi:hypothetical protein
MRKSRRVGRKRKSRVRKKTRVRKSRGRKRKSRRKQSRVKKIQNGGVLYAFDPEEAAAMEAAYAAQHAQPPPAPASAAVQPVWQFDPEEYAAAFLRQTPGATKEDIHHGLENACKEASEEEIQAMIDADAQHMANRGEFTEWCLKVAQEQERRQREEATAATERRRARIKKTLDTAPKWP